MAKSRKRMNFSEKVLRFVALFSIYLIVSLTFITANALAVLTYEIHGENELSGYAKSMDDTIVFSTVSDGNVSFVTQAGDELPLLCTPKNPSGYDCEYAVPASDIALSSDVHDLQFTFKQDAGTPSTKKGQLYIDGAPPRSDYFTAEKNSTGILFKYSFTDYYSTTQAEGPEASGCTSSGIGLFELSVQGKNVIRKTITDKECTITGEYFANLAGTYNDKLTYEYVVEDRLGNRLESDIQELKGDFKAPMIDSEFKIISRSTGLEASTLSTSAQLSADVVVEIEDADLDINNVYGDLSGLNFNPAVSIPYKNIKAACVKDSEDVKDVGYTCTFSDIQIRPESADFAISITAKDISGNPATDTITKKVNLVDNAGAISYIGTLKNQCTSDLSQCYVKPGMQIIQLILDSPSSFNNSLLNVGVDDSRTFAICALNSTISKENKRWVCTGAYNMPNSAGSVNVFLASDSYDDYGNRLSSDIERDIIIDNAKPELIGTVNVANDNHNDCAVNGDTVTYTFKVRETSKEPKIYADTSAFTTDDVQEGTCVMAESGTTDEWDCTLSVSNFITTPVNAQFSVMVKDLAGNELSLPQKLDVCKSSTTAAPNVVGTIVQGQPYPNIDRKTASKISVQAYVPLTITVKSGSAIMYMSVDRCTGKGQTGLDIMGSGHYITPNYGLTKSTTLVLYIGNNGAQLMNDSFEVNCTLSMRIRSGSTVYAHDQTKTVKLTINTYNNPLGTLDDATLQEIKAVKAHLRDTDSEITKYEKWDKSLGQLCKYAEMAGKMNQALQSAKAVIYAVCVVLKAIPYTSAYADKIWKPVTTILSKTHEIIDKYVWPPGTFSWSVGRVVKSVCLVYTCKHLDIGTYTGMMTDLASMGITNLVAKDGVGVPVADPNAKNGGNFWKNGNELVDANGKPVTSYYQKTTYDVKGVAIEPITEQVYSPEKNYPSTVQDAITPDVLSVQTKPTQKPILVLKTPYSYTTTPTRVTMPSVMDAGTKDSVLHTNDIITSALKSHQWIIDPYTSIHYDDTCVPAIIFNLKKDRQINCRYLRCLDEQKKSGLSKIVCDGDYKMNKCLYLDSADYLLHGQKTLAAFMGGLGDALRAAVPGIVGSTAYMVACKRYYTQGKTVITGWRPALCGIAGAVMSWKEIKDTFSNPIFTSEHKIDVDYCDGLDYSEASYVNTGDFSE